MTERLMNELLDAERARRQRQAARNPQMGSHKSVRPYAGNRGTHEDLKIYETNIDEKRNRGHHRPQ